MRISAAGQKERHPGGAPGQAGPAAPARRPRPRSVRRPRSPGRHPSSRPLTARDLTGTLRNTCRLPNEYRIRPL